MKNKKRRLRFRRVLLMAVLAVMTAGAAGGTLTYLTDNEKTLNRITAGNNVIEIVEEYDEPDPEPVEQFRKAIRVRNTGSEECFVRVRVAFSDGKIRDITEISPDGSTYYSADEYPLHLPDGWVFIPETDAEDGKLLGGYCYYTEVLPAEDPGTAGEEEISPYLTRSFRTTFASGEDVVPYEIYVYAESVQTAGKDGRRFEGPDAYREAWREFLTSK